MHCDVWAGFIFVNLDREPTQSLRDFLGPMVTALDGYPFDQMTERFHYRAEVGSNWKLYIDAFQEFYHAPVLHARQLPGSMARDRAGDGIRGAALRSSKVRTACVSTQRTASRLDPRRGVEADRDRSSAAGLFGPWETPDLGELPAGLNPGRGIPTVGPRLVPDLARTS